MGDYQKALSDFTRAITLDRSNTQAHEARAETLRKLGQDEGANSDDRMVGISPHTPPVAVKPNGNAPTVDTPSQNWPPDEEIWWWCEIEMGRHPVRAVDNSLIAQGKRYQRTRLVAYTPPLPSMTPTPHALGELGALEDYLKQNGWEPAGKGAFWYSLRFKHAAQ